MEKLMYCHCCYASFDGGEHKPAYVVSKDGSKEVQNLCTQCYERRQYDANPTGSGQLTPPPYGGLRIGTKRVPLDKKYPGFYLNQFVEPPKDIL
jgi:hypothetical protein